MSEGASKASRFQPNGWPTVIPRMFTPDVAGVVGFLKSVFNADGDMPAGAPAVVRIGDSVIMVSDGGGAREFLPTFLYVYVDNTDRVCQRAVEAGALIIEHPTDMPYGDRRAMLRDPWGNTWQIATHGPAQKASATISAAISGSVLANNEQPIFIIAEIFHPPAKPVRFL